MLQVDFRGNSSFMEAQETPTRANLYLMPQGLPSDKIAKMAVFQNLPREALD